jgi:hypothetical protein
MKLSFELNMLKALPGAPAFYYEVNKLYGFTVCEKFVKFCGVTSPNITITVSSIRPGKKGWKVVKLLNNPKALDPTQSIFVGKESKKFETLYCHRRMFQLHNTNIGWIKVDSR